MRQPLCLKWPLLGALAFLIGCGTDPVGGLSTDLADASADVGTDTGVPEPDRSADLSSTADTGGGTDSAESPDVGDDIGAAPASTLRFVNAVAIGPGVQIAVDGGPASRVLSFGQATAPIQLATGTHRIDITAAGSGEPQILWQDDVTVPADAAISAIIAWDDGPEGGVRLVFSEDGPEPTAGQAHLRVVHAMADAPSLTVDLWDDGLIDARVAALGVSTSRPLRLPAGEALVVRFRRADGAQDSVLRVTLDPLPSSGTTTLVLTGRSDRPTTAADGPMVLLLGERGEVALIRADPWVTVLNTSPNAPALDLFDGRAELADGVVFGELTRGFEVSRLTGSLALFPSDWGLSSAEPPGPRDKPVAEWPADTLEPGQRYLLIVAGLLGAESDEESLGVLAIREGFASLGATPLVRLVHAAPYSPALDLRMAGPFAWLDLLAEPLLAFGESTASSGLPLPEGALGLILATAGDDLPADTFILDVAAGARLVLVVVSAPGNSRRVGQLSPLGLVAIDTAKTPWQSALIAPTLGE